MTENIENKKKELFNDINNSLNLVTKNAEYLIKKSKSKNPYFDAYKHKNSEEMCGGITYEIDVLNGIHASSVSTSCCTKRNITNSCIIEGDLVIKKEDNFAKDAIKTIFNHPICAITDIHEHTNEKHIHVLCNTDARDMSNKLKTLNSILIK